MDLPLRIRSAPGPESVISVDGAFGAPGLNLSHWPGNTTPTELRHELSTGSALLFAQLPHSERERLTRGCVEICNNHVDTDGVCAMFAVAHPEVALRHATQLLEAAEAGDFFRPQNEAARRLDAIITVGLDADCSPWRSLTCDLDDDDRHEYDVRELIGRLPALLAGDLSGFEGTWETTVADWQADCGDLERVEHEQLSALDLVLWTAKPDQCSSRAGASSFDPSRQAIFCKCDADRVLVSAISSAGTTYRLLLSTLSWFDQDRRACLPRPNLAALAQELNRLEGTHSDSASWHYHERATPSPELWFGAPQLPLFASHAGSHLLPSRLAPETVRSLLVDALYRAAENPER